MAESVQQIYLSHHRADDASGQRLARDLRHALGNKDAVWYDPRSGTLSPYLSGNEPACNVPTAANYTLRYTFDGTKSRFSVNHHTLPALTNSGMYLTKAVALTSMVQDTSQTHQLIAATNEPYQADFASFSYQPR